MKISRITRASLAVPVVLALPLSMVACADKDDSATAYTVTATDDSCDVDSYEGTTGNNAFDIANDGSKITEFYVYTDGGRVLGEVENIGPGAARTLHVEIPEAGTYQVTCKPGMVGEGVSHDFEVTGDAVSQAEGDDQLTAAVDGYLRYVRSQTTALQESVDTFAQAIEDDDIDTAKELFAPTRTYYERIEPIAESFPDDLDPRIDLREADLEDGQEWTGFHAIEKQLWEDGEITDKTKQDAQQLVDDIAELVDGVAASDFSVQPVQIATGAQGLLDEISTSKITGEEDIFSHTDLWDFQANLDGSKAAIASLENAIDDRDTDLLAEINDNVDKVQAQLDAFREGDGFVSYDTVNEKDRKELSAGIDRLTEQVSKVAEVISQ
ncbi:iron uptake system protein EfeO [Corynebacterium sp. AOP40-9SA-29]|uniref:iron uptake system protein EfeO n=1 Tax=Corynebacterium sp. AOP40-9SA-29 TaxID=3457677 RepID=UPI0040332DC3